MSNANEKKKEYEDYIGGEYSSSAESLKNKYNAHTEGGYESNADAIKALTEQYQNSSFSYDPQSDPDFLNYAKYMREQGNMAMRDTAA